MGNEVLRDRRLAFAFLRFTLGLNILMHGAVRLPIMSAFVGGLVSWPRCSRASVPSRRSLQGTLRSDGFLSCDSSSRFPWVQHLHAPVCKVADVARDHR
jgi:hypothetical protein